jgi:Fe-S-cluster containining protein
VNNGNKNLWYSAGLHFECIGCGRCCSGPAEGYIWVTKEEIRLIAEYLKMTTGELKKKYLHRVGFRRTIIEDAITRDCIFLSRGENGKQCSIYPVRPSQCRQWPFWVSNLTSTDRWNTAGQKCPGINRGAFYSCEQIQAKRDNTRWWRNEGQ